MKKKHPYLFIFIAFIMVMTGIPTCASGAEDYTWSDWSTNNPGGGTTMRAKPSTDTLINSLSRAVIHQ